MKSCLIQRGHPEEVLNFTMSKLFSPTVKNQDESIDIVTFIHTYNPNVKFNKNIINESLNNFSDRSLKDTFLDKKPLVATRQGKNLQTLLTKARFDLVQRPTLSVRNNGLYTCQDNRCLLHKNNYIVPCTEFKFKLKSGRYFTWKYNRYFDCKCENVIYMIICNSCGGNYIGETECLRERMNNTKSHIRHTNRNSLPYIQHIYRCNKVIEPMFKIYPFYFENNSMFRKFKEWRFIKRFKPILNTKL